MREKLDEYFLSDEERILEVVKRNNGRVIFNRENASKMFGMDYDKVQSILSSLSFKKRLVWFQGGNSGTDVRLTKKFRKALEVEIEQ